MAYKKAFRHGKSLGDMFVFYKHLEKTAPSLHTKLTNDLKGTNFSLGGEIGNTSGSFEATAKKLRNMANIELRKEKGFIKEVFGADVSYQIGNKKGLNKNFNTDFIEAFNGFIQLKEVYQANKALLLADTVTSQGKKVTNKNAYSYFSSYFATAFNSRLNEMVGEILKLWQRNVSLDQAIKGVMDQEIPKAVDKALDKLSEAKPWSNNVTGFTKEQTKEVDTGLRAIADAINRVGRTGFGKKVITELKLDKISQILEEKIIENNLDSASSPEDIKIQLKKSIEYYKTDEGKAILGGNMMELVESVVLKECNARLETNKFVTTQIGGMSLKSDNVTSTTITIPTSSMEKILDDALNEIEKKNKTTRQKNIQAMDLFRKNMEKAGGKEYILYTSAKNYNVYGSTFKKNGFSAGTSMNIGTFQSVMDEVPHANGKGLATAVMQTLKGAIGEDELVNLQKSIASYLAYFLFDDFATIGVNIAKSSENSINCLHAFYLNGIYVPMSVLLNLLADAFESNVSRKNKEGGFAISSVTKVKIDRGEILFQYDGDSHGTENPFKSAHPWVDQREAAQKEIKISVHFLRNFTDIMSSLKP